MRFHLFFIFLVVAFSNSASAYLYSWNIKSSCGLDEYVQQYNSLHPQSEFFVEDVARFSLAETKESPMTQIDNDLQSEQLASQVAHCMVDMGPLPNDRLQQTLQATYQRYFYDRSSRRAMWLLLSVLDNEYLSKEQRSDSIQKRDSYWRNVSDSASKYVWVVSVAIWAIERGRGEVPAANARPTAVSAEAKAAAAGMRQTLFPRLLRSMNFWQWGKNVATFGAAAVSTGVGIGTPIYIARKYGWITTRDKTATDIAELTYHRLHWLELDCRARQLSATLDKREYKNGTADPQYRTDVRKLNSLISDFNFLTDVSQLYYVDFEWPADMKIDGDTITYKNVSLKCQSGFSKPDVHQITSDDVRTSVASAGKAYLKLYATVTLDPMKKEINAFLQQNGPEIQEALEKKAPVQVKDFLAKANGEADSVKDAPPERILSLISSFTSNKDRLKGREEFAKNWEAFLKTLKPETMDKMNKLEKDLVGHLVPASLMNEVILEQLFNTEQFPGNLVLLMDLGYALDQAAQAKIIPDTDAYLLPHELLFYLYSSAKADE